MIAGSASRPVRNALRASASRILRIAVALDRLGSRKGCRPYLVLCNGRAGSNALISLLNRHPSVLALNELMHPHAPIFGYEWHDRLLGGDSAVKAFRTRDPYQFLNHYCFSRVRAGKITHQGFKLIYWHALGEERERLWHRLRAMPSIKIIHLVRKNELARLVSEMRARQNNEWILPSNRQSILKRRYPWSRLEVDSGSGSRCSNQMPMHISTERAERYFQENSQLTSWFRAALEGGCVFEVEYEELLGKTASASALESLFGFLGVDTSMCEIEQLKPRTVKQSGNKLRDAIVNWTELAGYFEETEYSSFFSQE